MGDKTNVLQYLIIGVVIGCLGIVFYAFQALNITQFFSAFGVALMIAAAALVSGAFVGFIFGIPRTFQQGISQNNQEINSPENNLSGINYQVNTNLEQISDWLTKILVGISLTQIPGIIKAFENFSNYADQYGFSGFKNTKVFVGALLIYFLIGGFFVGYLWTRLYLSGKFRQADLNAVGAKLEEVENKVSKLEEQNKIDAKALGIVQLQLNPDSEMNPIEQDEINAAIIPASSSVKTQIYYLAARVRQDNWKEQKTKPKMELTIPIFRALIKSDSEGKYHANHGQLGFALKDQRQPSWEEADSELTKAIKIRGSWRDQGWLFYEFNRAICKINLDKAFNQKEASSEDTKKNILIDLQVAKNSPNLNRIINNDPTIQEWLSLNNIHETSLFNQNN